MMRAWLCTPLVSAGIAAVVAVTYSTPALADSPPLGPDCTVLNGNSQGDLIATCTSGPAPGQALYRNGAPVALPTTIDGVTYKITKLGNVTDSGWVSGTAEVVSPPVARGDSPVRVVRWTPEGQLQVFPPMTGRYVVKSITLWGATGDGHVLAKMYLRGRGDARMTWHSRLVWAADGTSTTYPDGSYTGTPWPGYDGGQPVAFSNGNLVVSGQYHNPSQREFGWTSWKAGTPGQATWMPCPRFKTDEHSAAAVVSPDGRIVVAPCATSTDSKLTELSRVTEQGAVALPRPASQEVPVGVTNDGVVLTQFSAVRGDTVIPLRHLIPQLPANAIVTGLNLRSDATVLLQVNNGSERTYVTAKVPS